MQARVLDACGGVDYLGTSNIDFYIECMAFYQGWFDLRWNYYGAYMCTPG
jgi:hypothetical protein